jgi:hypothetical protein
MAELWKNKDFFRGNKDSVVLAESGTIPAGVTKLSIDLWG